MAEAANEICEICLRASDLHYCTQCDQIFCDDCAMSHLRSKMNRKHICMTGSNIKTQSKSGGCKDHQEDCIYLCEDCNQHICRLCVPKAHINHALVAITDSNKKMQTEISRCLDSKVDNVRSSAKLIEGRTKTYKTEVEATVKVIMEHGNLIKDMVDKKVESLIKALRELESTELHSLSKANKDCNDLLGEITRQQQIYQDMIKQCDEVALFHKMKKIKSDIDNLKIVDVTRLILSSVTYNRNLNFSDVEKLVGNLTFQ